MSAPVAARARWIDRAPLAVGAVLALLAALAAAQSLGALGGVPRALLAAPLVLGGAAWPIVLRASPTEPSLFKLAVLSLLLSPPLVALAWCAARLALDAERADALVFALLGAAQLLALRRRIVHEPLGKAAWLALGCALAAALASGAALARAGGAALLPHGAVAWHCGVALALERAVPPENPWLAGAALPAEFAVDAILAVLARALGTFPSVALAVASVVALLASGACLYLIGAPLWREPRRAALVPLCALLGPHALVGLGLRVRDGASATLSADAGVESGLAPFLDLGATPLALALALGAWLAAAHALRHGRAPWPLWCATLASLAIAVDPVLGVAAAAPIVLVALAHPGELRARERVLGALAIAIVPALALVAWLGWSVEPIARSASVVEPAFALDALAPLALAAAPLVLGRARVEGGEGDERGRRTILLLLLAAVACALAAPWLGASVARRQVDLVRLASLAAGVLAAGGLVDLAGGRARAAPVRRAAALVVLAALVAGGGRRAAGTLASVARQGERALALAIEGRALVSTAGDDRARAYAWLREDARRRGGDPVLVCSVDRIEDHFGRNRAPHVAPLLADATLWVDRGDELAGGDPRWRARLDDLARLFAESLVGEPDTSWDPRLFDELDRRGRAAWIVIEERDRASTRGQIERRLPRLGAERAHDEGSVSIWWRPPRGEARR